MHASGILSMFSDQNQHMQLARSAGRGNSHDAAALAKLVGKQYLNPVDLHMRAHEKSLAMLDAISRGAEKVERRKDKIHKQLYERRATLERNPISPHRSQRQ